MVSESSHQYDDAICQCGDVMPRAKPDSVIVHRIDMQAGVKESLDAYLAATAATNALGAAGQIFVGMVSAFAAPLGGILAALVAKEGIEEITSRITAKFEEAGHAIVQPLRDMVTYYQAIEAAIRNHVGALESPSPFLENINNGVVPDPETDKDMAWIYGAARGFWTSGEARNATLAWTQGHREERFGPTFGHSTHTRGIGQSGPPTQGWYWPYFMRYLPQARVIQYLKDTAKNPLSRNIPPGPSVNGVQVKDAIAALEELLL